MPKLLTSTEREGLISQIELADALATRARINGLKYFTPTGKQEAFIRSIGDGKKFVGIFSGANRAGKSCLEIATLGNIVFGPQNAWFNHPLFKDWKYAKRARIGTNPKNLEEIGAIQTGIKEWWNPKLYTSHKQGHSYDSLYKTKTGWIIDLMSYEQAVKEWESVLLGLVLCDEPPPKPIFDAIVARLADGGMVLIFMTPLGDAGYLFDDLLGTVNKKTTVTYCDIEDSCVQHGVRGFRNHSLIETMLSFLDPDEIEARAHGKPMHLSGAIYKIFNPSVHIVKDFPIPEDWKRVNVCDPHDAFPFGFIWCAIDPTGDYYIYDEYPNEPFERIHGTNLTFNDYVDIVRDKEGDDRISGRIMDPNFGAKRQGSTGKTVRAEMAELGLSYRLCWNDDLTYGHNKVRERLKYDPSRPVNMTNKPKLFVLKSCRNTWVSMIRYGWKPNQSDEQSDSQKLSQKYKHFTDKVRYLCVTNLDDVTMVTEDEQVSPMHKYAGKAIMPARLPAEDSEGEDY